jgi:hypothetical protein
VFHCIAYEIDTALLSKPKNIHGLNAHTHANTNLYIQILKKEFVTADLWNYCVISLMTTRSRKSKTGVDKLWPTVLKMKLKTSLCQEFLKEIITDSLSF